jgi:hypothetical protein
MPRNLATSRPTNTLKVLQSNTFSVFVGRFDRNLLEC